jgi:hypothetical protein
VAARAGWDLYPVGGEAQPEDMPAGTLAGIIIAP